jgi:DNA polymerase III epsilon subunit-like protein
MGDSEQATMYFVCDIETTGSCPGVHSLLSLGCAAYQEDGKLVDQFYATVDDGMRWESSTKEWWDKQPRPVWEAARIGRVSVESAMVSFHEWVCATVNGCLPVCVTQPSGFDFTWIYYYMHRYTKQCSFVRRSLDIKSYAQGLLGKEYAHVNSKTNWPEAWRSSHPHTHNALEDCTALADTFFKMKAHGKSPTPTDLTGRYMLAMSPRGGEKDYLAPISYVLEETAWSALQQSVLPSTTQVRIDGGHTVPGTPIRMYSTSVDEDPGSSVWLVQFEGTSAPSSVRHTGGKETGLGSQGFRFYAATSSKKIWVALVPRLARSIEIYTPEVAFVVEFPWLNKVGLWG